ncbi:hypothetical protein [Longimicrobium sp.]|uniref:hypothetical protein n=1 Tax=Longimicrobium sp. TaxID=2029185 RepID=UPI002E375E51|nr:hypothetical protein [Longimicrobium sp.]HEX6039626.1 hypothetical protein [Longimicrobium sp.]
MLIDEFMPQAQFAERHAVRVAAPPERAWDAVRALDLRGSPVVRALFALRSLPALFSGRARGKALGGNMEGLLRSGFVLLAEDPPREIVLGLTGRFWTPAGGITHVEPGEFRAFDRPGMAVAAWNFTILPTAEGSLVATETRVRCTDEAARRSFARYWRVIRPFSGLIRREALRAVRRSAERSR